MGAIIAEVARDSEVGSRAIVIMTFFRVRVAATCSSFPGDEVVKAGLRLYSRITEVWPSTTCHAGVKTKGEYKARLESSRWSWYFRPTVGVGRRMFEIATV